MAWQQRKFSFAGAFSEMWLLYPKALRKAESLRMPMCSISKREYVKDIDILISLHQNNSMRILESKGVQCISLDLLLNDPHIKILMHTLINCLGDKSRGYGDTGRIWWVPSNGMGSHANAVIFMRGFEGCRRLEGFRRGQGKEDEERAKRRGWLFDQLAYGLQSKEVE
jgi:hypothetical protein